LLLSVKARYNQGNDDRATPGWIKDGLFAGWFDPCPLGASGSGFDGLKAEWSADRVFVNPPYSNPLPWVEKAIEAAENGKTVVLLLKHDSSTRWFSRLHEAGARFLAVIGRVAFTGCPAPFPSVLVVVSGLTRKESGFVPGSLDQKNVGGIKEN
jgi:hypothetical protein